MNILFVSSEVYPFSKTGGLGDVAGALPESLAKLGHQVLVVSPWYKTLKQHPLWIGDIDFPFEDERDHCGLGSLEKNGVQYAFMGHLDFERESLYGYEDDVKRFARFCRAVPQIAERLGFAADIVHCNDWHSAYLTMIISDGWHIPQNLVKRPTVFTIHNAQYQGWSELTSTLHWLRLPQSLQDSYFNHFGGANAMQAGVGFADQVTTVSPTYAEEIKEVAYGYGLDGTFRHISNKLTGILNGLDTRIWDSAEDSNIPVTYDSNRIEFKHPNKLALCDRLNLNPAYPLLSVVSRFADQKGIDIMLDAVPQLIDQGWSLAFLGSGESELEAAVSSATTAFPERIGSYIGYSESLAHLVYAGSDALAIPSRFEPCGLNQMIAMRYGTIPIARSTGGLRDTIDHGNTGFLFESSSAEGLLWASNGALQTYQQHPDYWQSMMRRGMSQDFSWERSAKHYEHLYEKMLGQHG